MKNTVKYFSLFVAVFIATSSNAQVKDTSRSHLVNMLVQFSGVIVTADSLKPVPYATVLDKKTGRGTVSDYYGFFSFVAIKGDTIIFSSVGMKKSYFVIPDTLKDNRYSLIQMMQNDTIVLNTAFVYPWPTKEQFAQAFVNLELPEDYVARAERNMKIAEIKEQSVAIGNDSEMAFRQAMDKEKYRMYYAGQVPPNNLLNPVAWYKFIQSWKAGEFKRQ